MRKISILLLFTAFATGQYAKQLSYWQCKLVNIVLPSSPPCDCERLVIDTDTDNPLATPVTHTHLHLDDLYDTADVEVNTSFALTFGLYKKSPTSALCEGMSALIDKPPSHCHS